jgi:hypothetical protein
VRSQAKIRARPTGADERKARFAILDEEAAGVGLVDLAGEHSNRARQAPPLQAQVRQVEAGAPRRLEDVLVRRRVRAEEPPVGKFELDRIRVGYGL